MSRRNRLANHLAAAHIVAPNTVPPADFIDSRVCPEQFDRIRLPVRLDFRADIAVVLARRNGRLRALRRRGRVASDGGRIVGVRSETKPRAILSAEKADFTPDY